MMVNQTHEDQSVNIDYGEETIQCWLSWQKQVERLPQEKYNDPELARLERKNIQPEQNVFVLLQVVLESWSYKIQTAFSFANNEFFINTLDCLR